MKKVWKKLLAAAGMTAAEITEKESESPTESTTADSFVIPLPPQAG